MSTVLIERLAHDRIVDSSMWLLKRAIFVKASLAEGILILAKRITMCLAKCSLGLLKELICRICNSRYLRTSILGLLIFYVSRHYLREYARYYFSMAIEMCSVKCDSGKMREQLRIEPFPPVGKLYGQHSHPEAAAIRTSCNNMVDNLIFGTGFIPWSVSMSPREQRAGLSGSRLYYFSKDTEAPVAQAPLHPGSCYKLIDVDYYVDMPQLISHAKPIALYTFSPNTIAGSVPDGTYCTMKNDLINLKINGGAEYQHPLWDYDHDHIQVDYFWGSVISLCESRVHPLDVTRRVVTITPIRKIYGPLAWFLDGYRLKRRSMVVNDKYCVSHFQEKVDNKVVPSWSFGVVEDRVCATIPEEKMKTAIIRAKMSKQLAVSDIERVFRQVDNIDAAFAASTFLQIWNERPIVFETLFPIRTLHKSFDGLDPHYQTLYPLVTEEGKNMGRLIIDPIVTEPAVSPKKSVNNDHACIRGRLLEVKSNVKLSDLRPVLRRYMYEFASLLIPDHLAHTGVPYDYAQMESLQNRPSQLAASAKERLWADLNKFFVRSFQKSETYAKVTAPRNISNCPTYHRVRYGSYTHAFAELLKRTEWYAFGLHPREISDRMVDVVTGAQYVTPTDFSKMDGTHSEALCEFELILLRRFFAPCYHTEVETLNKEQRNCNAVTAEGIVYDPEYSRLSGSGETSVFNTTDNAFTVYATLRSEMHVQEAWQRLGLYGGDDGCTGNLRKDSYERVCKQLGLIAKVEKINAGNNVPFLGRVFLDPWTTPESVIDIPRCLSKIHMYCHNDKVPTKLILARRCLGLSQTDPMTPVIKDFVRNVLRLTGPPSDIENERYNLKRMDQWWNKYDNPFVSPTIDSDTAWSYTLGALQTERAHIERVIKYWDGCTDVEKIGLPKELRFFSDRKVEIDASIGGEVLTSNKPAAPLRITYPTNDNYKRQRSNTPWTGFKAQRTNTGINRARWR